MTGLNLNRVLKPYWRISLWNIFLAHAFRWAASDSHKQQNNHRNPCGCFLHKIVLQTIFLNHLSTMYTWTYCNRVDQCAFWYLLCRNFVLQYQHCFALFCFMRERKAKFSGRCCLIGNNPRKMHCLKSQRWYSISHVSGWPVTCHLGAPSNYILLIPIQAVNHIYQKYLVRACLHLRTSIKNAHFLCLLGWHLFFIHLYNACKVFVGSMYCTWSTCLFKLFIVHILVNEADKGNLTALGSLGVWYEVNFDKFV